MELLTLSCGASRRGRRRNTTARISRAKAHARSSRTQLTCARPMSRRHAGLAVEVSASSSESDLGAHEWQEYVVDYFHDHVPTGRCSLHEELVAVQVGRKRSDPRAHI